MRLRISLPGLLLLSALAGPAFAAPPNPEPGADLYAARRARLLEQLPKGAMAVLNASEEDSTVFTVYRPDSNFWYLTGLGENQAVAVLAPGAEGKTYTLYSRPKTWEAEQWNGYLAGQDAAKTRYGADASFAGEEFGKQMADLMRAATSLWIMDGGDATFRDRLLKAWDRRSANSPVALPVYNLAPTIAQMRLYKDPTEVALLRHAVDLSVQAHLAALPLVSAGTGEWTVRAAMTSVCAGGGAPRMAYSPIVGSGVNAVVLHYAAASKVMAKGDMVVNDTACEYGMYAADVTRSYPVGGVFSPEQKAIYELVEQAQAAGAAKAVLGAQLHEVHDATIDVIVDGLLKLGIMKGEKATIIADKSFRTFYPHGSSHWIGLDVHDVGSYERTNPPNDVPEKLRNMYTQSKVALKPGMAFTIEPGIYIPEKSAGVDPKWWNIGVRIEDDYLVTDKGLECLSCAMPRDIPTLEKLMRKRG